MAACLRFTRRVWKSFLDNKGHDAQCFPQLKIERAVPGKVEASLKIASYNLNRTKTLHGGLILSLTDTLGSLAVSTRGNFMTGVSADIGTSFVRPAGLEGDELRASATLVQMGRTLAFTRVEFMNAKGELVAYGHHTKFVGKALEHPNNVKLSQDGETLLEGEIDD
ncbi:Thioesterase/thiol ester dehydrase-isomerase [Exidia glandulosa HHB12029]|uniref:Thioesterase/thiol ester dehydrase-isomerase n=1 Tax=Exidia glandulosa HHB12029 TaxID=1314781 RepID=A0A165BJQ6_EXIGL|nr:Thioesterase/thiol ester dehydrase-isomerase [Exidia glandulosa HHB12029]